MCLHVCSVVSPNATRWEGDHILNNPVIPAARLVPGTRRRYPIDIREFLTSPGNAVVHQALHDCIARQPEGQRACFDSSAPGSFDQRVRAVCAYLSETVRYRRKERGFDQWLFPDETLAMGGGDCEDHAFLLASLLLAAGVSGYVLRVALGTFRDLGTGQGHDHAWVVYQDEAGAWLLLDPLIYTRGRHQARAAKDPGRPADPGRFQYQPRFVFNDEHLWAVRDPQDERSFLDYCADRRFWDSFDPAFAASVHNSLFDTALAGMPWAELQYAKAVSLEADVNLATYDPRDHFDNGFVPEAWDRVKQRLDSGSLTDFARAGHAIGDFYAHTSWGVFGPRDANGALQPLLDPASPGWPAPPDYGGSGPFPLTDPRFSTNPALWKGTHAEVPALWSGKLISGRYAQDGDPSQGDFEKLTGIPGSLKHSPGFADRGSLPHHDEIAVDSPDRPDGHRLFPDGPSFQAQFELRKDAALRHLKAVYAGWKGR